MIKKLYNKIYISQKNDRNTRFYFINGLLILKEMVEF